MSVFISHQINPLWAELLFKPHVYLFFRSLEMFWSGKGHLFPSPACHFIPERGYGRRWNPRCDLYSWVQLRLSLFLSLSTRFQSADQRLGFATNPLRDHSYCKPIMCPVGSGTHTNRIHNHALFHCHNTLDWFVIVQLLLTLPTKAFPYPSLCPHRLLFTSEW